MGTIRASTVYCVIVLACWASTANAAKPEWLTIEGESRARFEVLDGQFRADRTGGDQLLALRSLILAEVNTGPLIVGAELQDSRTYAGDTGTPLTSSVANPLDVLQLYLRFEDKLTWPGHTRSNLKLGRQTVSIGSKRQIERVDYANVIKSYTGVHYVSEHARGDELHLLWVVPTARFPNTFGDLDDNELAADEEQWGRQIWAAHYRRADLLPNFAPGVWGEIFVYGLSEKDTRDFATPNRAYVAPGFRLYREPEVSQWDMDIEGALRRGHRNATALDSDHSDLKVDASMLFAAVGYTFDAPWQPRIALEYYYASGDDDPTDNNFDQHERLFGSRRSDLNNTSIHGPLTPANLNAPGFRVEVKPGPRWDARFYYHAAYLASDTDSWVIGRHRDITGSSGDFLGHVLDSRVRYWLIPDQLRLELGASAMIFGDFAENVPGGPQGSRTLFGYTQFTLSF